MRGMPVKLLGFSEFKKIMEKAGHEPLDILVKNTGIVYVVAVTREKCPGCEKQKPLFEKLSDRLSEKYPDQIRFFTVQSAFSREHTEEAKQCAIAFQTVAFPTYVIAIKDSDGKTRETYRAIEPPMSEIERNVRTSSQIASWVKKPKD